MQLCQINWTGKQLGRWVNQGPQDISGPCTSEINVGRAHADHMGVARIRESCCHAADTLEDCCHVARTQRGCCHADRILVGHVRLACRHAGHAHVAHNHVPQHHNYARRDARSHVGHRRPVGYHGRPALRSKVPGSVEGCHTFAEDLRARIHSHSADLYLDT